MNYMEAARCLVSELVHPWGDPGRLPARNTSLYGTHSMPVWLALVAHEPVWILYGFKAGSNPGQWIAYREMRSWVSQRTLARHVSSVVKSSVVLVAMSEVGQ